MHVTVVDLLRRHGWTPGEVLGGGMEGTVVDLSPDRVAKVWHGRSRQDLALVLEFGAALDRASLPVATPSVVELLEDDGLVVTIERKLHGEPLRTVGAPTAPVAGIDAVRLTGDILDGLSRAVVSPGLAVLPILPGDRPFGPLGSFAVSLADLVESRFRGLPDLLRREIEDIDRLVDAIAVGLRALPEPDRVALIHGDLVPPNILVQDGRVSGVLDFGFLTTLGDPQFDAAITASIFDMYGPNAGASEDVLTEAFLSRFDHDQNRYGLYRAAYAVITNAYFGTDGTDGHFTWCARMLRRPDVRAAVLSHS